MNGLTIAAIIDNLPAVTAFVDEQLEALNCPLKAQMQIDVAIDEVFSNIAYYAYAPGSGPVTIQVEPRQEPPAVVIRFLDHGIPYDPLSKADPDATLSTEERDVGDLGIYMVKKTMDAMAYVYENGQNILTIEKMF